MWSVNRPFMSYHYGRSYLSSINLFISFSTSILSVIHTLAWWVDHQIVQNLPFLVFLSYIIYVYQNGCFWVVHNLIQSNSYISIFICTSDFPIHYVFLHFILDFYPWVVHATDLQIIHFLLYTCQFDDVFILQILLFKFRADSRLRPANERRRYKVTPSLFGWAQTWNQPWNFIATVRG